MGKVDERANSIHPTFVLIDTSVWRSQPLLRTPLGAALLHYLHRSESSIALPEVVEREVVNLFRRVVSDARDRVESDLRLFQGVIGSVPEFRSPTDDEAEEAVRSRFEELGETIERVPFTFEHAQGALDRVVDGTPPNGAKNQQFKDSAIWEAVMSLATRRPVFFVTGDKGFFENSDPKQGVAANLQAEIAGGLSIRVFDGLSACLEVVQESAPPLDLESVNVKVDEQLRERVGSALGEHGLVPADLASIHTDAFATGDPARVAISTTAAYELDDERREENRVSPQAFVGATATYDMELKQVTNLSLESLVAEWIDGELGFRKRLAFIFAAASVGLGLRNVPLQIREPVI
jgi:hypothetical protein